MLTYGDGLDQNFNKLLKFHKNNKKICTITIVRPPARFGGKNKKKYYNKISGKKTTDSWMDKRWVYGVKPKNFHFLNKKQF